MNIVPRYLYLFQCLPLFLSRSFFSIDSLFYFIWVNKSLQFQISLLQRNRSGEVWGYQICNFIARQPTCKKLYPASSEAPGCHANRSKPKQYTDKPIVISTLRIWKQIKQHFGWNTLSLNTPMCNTELFKPAKIDARFSLWERRGLHAIGEFYILQFHSAVYCLQPTAI